jgi:thiamine-monophosphate kinase
LTSPEFALIARHFTRVTRHTRLGVGDDAALLDAPHAGHALAVSTDLLVEGTHFLRGTDPHRLGHKVLAVNLSDLAAMGARPRWAFLAMALPEADDVWLAAFADGFHALAAEHGVDLAGGDTTRGPRGFCVTVIGEIDPLRALRRDGARPGDDVWVSGCTGEAAAGLAVLQGRCASMAPSDAARCIERLERPQPRVALGLALAGLATAAIDVSDGLLADAAHLGERSGALLSIDLVRMPQPSTLAALDPGARRDAVLSGGDDYELVFCAPRASRDAIVAAAAAAAPDCSVVTRIGRVEAADAVSRVGGARLLDRDGREIAIARAGFDHFAAAAA